MKKILKSLSECLNCTYFKRLLLTLKLIVLREMEECGFTLEKICFQQLYIFCFQFWWFTTTRKCNWNLVDFINSVSNKYLLIFFTKYDTIWMWYLGFLLVLNHSASNRILLWNHWVYKIQFNFLNHIKLCVINIVVIPFLVVALLVN